MTVNDPLHGRKAYPGSGKLTGCMQSPERCEEFARVGVYGKLDRKVESPLVVAYVLERGINVAREYRAGNTGTPARRRRPDDQRPALCMTNLAARGRWRDRVEHLSARPHRPYASSSAVVWPSTRLDGSISHRSSASWACPIARCSFSSSFLASRITLLA
jgi:hypothetical protein